MQLPPATVKNYRSLQISHLPIVSPVMRIPIMIRFPDNACSAIQRQPLPQREGFGNFEHSSTGFDLKGRHQQIDCFSCHANTSDPLGVFQDKKRVSENSCISCHKDEHEGKYGTNCVKCHRESSFLSLRSMDFFDHTVTDYPLEGKHMEVNCRQCHKKSYSDPINFTACNNCHTDYHKGEFTENNMTQDCKACHSLEKGFDYSLYTLESSISPPHFP